MSWSSIAAVVASGLLVAGPIMGDPRRAPEFAELCTTVISPEDAGSVNMARIFVGTGVVVDTDPGRRVMTISHRDIRGLMPPMTHMFRVKSGSLVENLRPKDEIRFRMTGSNMTIVAVAVLRGDK